MKDDIFLLCDRVRETAFALHCGAPKLVIRKYALSDA
jgi:hypothetical protein